jgi:hypothetical protein
LLLLAGFRHHLNPPPHPPFRHLLKEKESGISSFGGGLEGIDVFEGRIQRNYFLFSGCYWFWFVF